VGVGERDALISVNFSCLLQVLRMYGFVYAYLPSRTSICVHKYFRMDEDIVEWSTGVCPSRSSLAVCPSTSIYRVGMIAMVGAKSEHGIPTSACPQGRV
jgi:hypothetical protein